jgi:hypothetical protein
LKAGPNPAGGGMPQRSYSIRKALLAPLGVDAFLLMGLLAISLLLKGDATEKLVFTLFFLPTLVLFSESLYRRVVVTDEGITIRKLGRAKAVAWGEITHVGSLTIHKKVYILLTTVKGFFIVSNAHERFSALVEEIVTHVEGEKVEEEVRLLTGGSLAGIANIVSAWVAAVFMVGIILMKLIPFIV